MNQSDTVSSTTVVCCCLVSLNNNKNFGNLKPVTKGDQCNDALTLDPSTIIWKA